MHQDLPRRPIDLSKCMLDLCSSCLPWQVLNGTTRLIISQKAISVASWCTITCGARRHSKSICCFIIPPAFIATGVYLTLKHIVIEFGASFSDSSSGCTHRSSSSATSSLSSYRAPVTVLQLPPTMAVICKMSAWTWRSLVSWFVPGFSQSAFQIPLFSFLCNATTSIISVCSATANYIYFHSQWQVVTLFFFGTLVVDYFVKCKKITLEPSGDVLLHTIKIQALPLRLSHLLLHHPHVLHLAYRRAGPWVAESNYADGVGVHGIRWHDDLDCVDVSDGVASGDVLQGDTDAQERRCCRCGQWEGGEFGGGDGEAEEGNVWQEGQGLIEISHYTCVNLIY